MEDNTKASGRVKEVRITGAMTATLVGLIAQTSRLEDKLINMSMSASPAMRAMVNQLTDRFNRAQRMMEDKLRGLVRDAEVDARRGGRKNKQTKKATNQNGQQQASSVQSKGQAKPNQPAKPSAAPANKAPKAKQENTQKKPLKAEATQPKPEAPADDAVRPVSTDTPESIAAEKTVSAGVVSKAETAPAKEAAQELAEI